jgi:uncharacterized membrane protein
MNYTKIGISAIIMLLIDFIYLTIFSNHFNNQVKLIQGTKIQMNYLGAIICYLCLFIAWSYFIIKKNGSYSEAFLLGALIYGVFETTNKAIFTNWNWDSVIIDTIWGGTLFLLLTYIARNLLP